MYHAIDDKIYYSHPTNEADELFLTVHQTRDCKFGVNHVAMSLAHILNNLALTTTASDITG